MRAPIVVRILLSPGKLKLIGVETPNCHDSFIPWHSISVLLFQVPFKKHPLSIGFSRVYFRSKVEDSNPNPP